MASETWRQVRDLFDAVCELPREQWQAALEERCDEAAIRDEVLQLLRSQTVGLSRVSNRLDTALARALAPEFGVGERIGPWRLTERIAQGGMGTVFKAERADGVYQRTVAIKLLHGMPGASEVERLGVERQVLADLQLPNVARLYDGGTTPDNHPYLVMEYIDGVPLDSWCSDNEMGLEQRLQLFLDICDIVQSAHEQLVLHCDLKPRNVLVLSNGQPVLLDFGLARLLNEAREKQDAGYCTPAYASPELIRGQPVGAAGDVYSLGVMLLELLSCQPCTRETEDVDLPVVAPSQLAAPQLAWRRRLRGDLDAITAKACALDARQRYRSVEALSADVRRYLQQRPVSAREGGRLYHLRKRLRRNWHAVAAGSAALALLLVFIVGLVETRRQARDDAAIARQVSNFMVGVFETADPYLRTERGQEELTSRQLLDKAALQVGSELRDAPAQLARMQAVLGLAYQNSGVTQQAEQNLQQAYEGFMRADVARPMDAAFVLANLSRLKTAAGEGAQGQVLAERGLALVDADADDQGVRARLYAAKALALTGQQRFDAAEAAFDLAQRLYLQQPGEEDAWLHELLYNRGLMYLRWGRQDQAERAFRQVLAGLHGRRTSMTLAVELNLAQILREQANFPQALELLQKGQQHALHLYGPQSRFVLMQHDALADLYVDMGELTAADQQFRVRQRLSAALDGEESVGYSMGVFNHGSLYELRGDIDQAEANYRQAWAIRRARLGESSPTAMRAEAGLGRVLMRRGRMEEAGVHLLHADQGMTAALPADAPGRLEARLLYVRWLVRQNRLVEADQLLAGLGTMPALLRAELPSVRADLLQRQEDTYGALRLRRQAIEQGTRLYGENTVQTALQRLDLAETLLQSGDAPGAQLELARAKLVLTREQVASSPDRRRLEGLMLLSSAMAKPTAHHRRAAGAPAALAAE